MKLPAGARLAQYEILSELGAGGMSVIYRARDTRLGREVALKVMAAHIAGDPVMRSRFATEANAAGIVCHPGILSVHELSISTGTPFVVMELLEGQNLRDRMTAGVVPLREALHVAVSIADALSAAHAHGIVHRDLKPENVFLTRDGGVKILDFGLALLRRDSGAQDTPWMHTSERGVLGTFGYMSPEQISGGDVDGRTDVFALGCLLYEILCGRPLFAGATPQEFLSTVMEDAPLDLRVSEPLLPCALRPVVARAVERDPARRFQSARDLGDALRGVLAGLAPAAPTGPDGPATWPA